MLQALQGSTVLVSLYGILHRDALSDRVEPDRTPLFAAHGPEVIKLFFVLNSVEHKMLKAHKYKNIKKFSTF